MLKRRLQISFKTADSLSWFSSFLLKLVDNPVLHNLESIAIFFGSFHPFRDDKEHDAAGSDILAVREFVEK